MRRAAATLALATALAAVPVTAAAAHEGGGTDASGQAQTEQGAPTHDGHPRIRRMAHRIAARAAAEAIGVSVQEVRDAVLGGQTIAAYAESKGVDPDAVESAVAAALGEAIDEALANGRISEERATAAKGHVDEAAERIVTSLPRVLTGDAQG